MCLLCELLLRSGELKEIVNDLFWHLIDLCIDVEKLWFWYMLSWEMRWELRCWVVDDERMIWAIEIVDLKCVELDWIDELCELFVFDGNELVV